MIAGASRAEGNFWLWQVLRLVFLVLPLSVAAQDDAKETAGSPAIAVPSNVITRIEFTGNRVTQPQILLQEMLVKEGDIADPVLIERSRQAIMDLGLFTSVHAVVEPGDGGSVLRISIKEKYYILPVPKLNRDEENNFSLGAELTFDNLAGLNQQLKIRYETDDATGLSGGQIDTHSLSYNYPRVLGSAYLFRTDISQQRSPIEVVTGSVLSSLYEKEAWTASLQVSRWINRAGPSRGWQVGAGMVWRRNSYDYVSGTTTDTFQGAQAVGLTLLGQFIDVRDYLFSREGLEYGYSGEFGAPVLGSDTRYTRHEFFYRKFILLENSPHENIDFQARLGLSSGDIFPGDSTAYSVGGSRTLRGYDSGSFPGNAFVLLNVQYLRPLFGYNPLRGALFLDVGNAYPSNEEINLGDLKWSVGIGFRLRLKSFVKIDLRVDASCVHDTGECKFFAGTREVF
jgi:outer membrane protein assembly factor BamA